MKRAYFHRAGRLQGIVYNRDVVVSLGERGYARWEARPPSRATLARLDALAERGFGTAATEASGGAIWRPETTAAAPMSVEEPA